MLVVKIILPSKTLLNRKADIVNVPGSMGMFGVLPNHAKFISNIDTGVLTISTDDTKQKYFICGGIAQVTGSELNIVTEFAVSMEDKTKEMILQQVNDYCTISGNKYKTLHID